MKHKRLRDHDAVVYSDCNKATMVQWLHFQQVTSFDRPVNCFTEQLFESLKRLWNYCVCFVCIYKGRIFSSAFQFYYTMTDCFWLPKMVRYAFLQRIIVCSAKSPFWTVVSYTFSSPFIHPLSQNISDTASRNQLDWGSYSTMLLFLHNNKVECIDVSVSCLL